MQTKHPDLDIQPQRSAREVNDITLLVQNPHVPVRIKNAIQQAAHYDELPVRTVRDYMSDPQASFHKLLKVPNIGRKSVGLLHELILEADEKLKASGTMDTQESAVDNSSTSRETDDIDEKLKLLCKAILATLSFPDALINIGVSTRLYNALQHSPQTFRTFPEFIENWHVAKNAFLQQPHCGQTTVEELEERSYHVISERLDELGISDQYAQTIFTIICTNTVSDIDKRDLLDIIVNRLKVARREPPTRDEPLSSLSEYVKTVLSDLPERQRDILSRRYGLFHVQCETLKQIAGTYGVTRERVRQIEATAKRTLSKPSILRGLTVRLREEGTLDKVFNGRRILLTKQAKSVFRKLPNIEQFSIELAYRGIANFLREEAIPADAGWVLDESFVHNNVEIEDRSNTLRSRIAHILQQSHLPIRLSKLVSKIPEFPSEEIRHEMEDRFGAQFDDDILQSAPQLPAAIRYALILRKAGHGLHCRQIRSENHRIFGRDESINYIGNVLAKRPEVLIVARGTYDLYENLPLSEEDIRGIRDRVYDCLASRGQYISAKVLYADLFESDRKHLGPAFSHTMLLGILQDDDRFDVRRGLMVGLSSFGPEQGFTSLQHEVWEFVSAAQSPVTTRDVLDCLADRRDVFESSVVWALENNPDILSISAGRYDLVARVIGPEGKQQELCIACALALQEGPKSVLALSELIETTWGTLGAHPLRSFLGNQKYFKLTDLGVRLVATPDSATRYLQAMNEIESERPDLLNDLEQLGTAITGRGAPNLVNLDPRIVLGLDTLSNTDDPDSMLKQLLADFEV